MNKQELATRIWATANELRKSIKASEYKDYILGFMFYKYLCDKELDYLHELGGEEEDIIEVDNETKDKFKDGIGFYISYEHLFSVWKGKGLTLGAKNVSEALDDFYLNLNGRYKTVFDKVFSALQSGLTKLGENSGSRDKAVRDIVELVDLIPPTSRDYDVLGYIYEYLIQQFSSEAKKDGAFYTPHEVTSLMSRIVAERLKGRNEVYCYDPTVGSGGLLLNIGKEVGRYVPFENIKYYGQELITETANLAKMNLFMQGVPVQNMNMRNANTLEDDWPYFDEQTAYEPLFVDAVVSNPPYSAHYEPSRHQTDERFKGYGLAPSGKADYAFLLHCLYHIKKDGIMAIVLPHGVLFRGDSEGEIRKNLILNHNIETIISLPEQLFFATQIPVIIMILSKGRKADDILFVDASQSCKKNKKQNILEEKDVQKIFDTVIARKDVANYAHLASMEEIEANDYNLNIPRYVSAAVQEASYDLYSVMTGKVSDKELDTFNFFWTQFPNLREKLMNRIGEYNVFSNGSIKELVLEEGDVQKYLCSYLGVADKFRKYLVKMLTGRDATPAVHTKIVEELFTSFNSFPLVDVYDVFQAFEDNWGQIDSDLIRIENEGWQICSETEPNIVLKKNTQTKKFDEEQKGWKGKIMPFDLIKKTYFLKDYDKMNSLTDEADAAASEYTDIWENMDEDARTYVCKGDDETVFDIKKFKPVIKAGFLANDVIDSLKSIQNAIEREKKLRKEVKAIAAELENKAKRKIEALSEDEVSFMLELKWITPIAEAVNKVGNDVLAQFVKSLENIREKYSDPLSELSEQIAETNGVLKMSLAELTGSDTDMEAVRMLMEEL